MKPTHARALGLALMLLTSSAIAGCSGKPAENDTPVVVEPDPAVKPAPAPAPAPAPEAGKEAKP